MCECSVCLNPVRYTRQSKQLECGHLYHTHCIDEWVSAGGDTCPMCRSQLNKPKFKVTLTIENTSTNYISENHIITEALLELMQGEIRFDASSSEELYQIISSLGILRGVDVDALVLDTEG